MVAKARRRQGDDAITMPANDLQLFFHSGYDRRHLRKLRKNGAHTKNDAVRGGPVNCHFSLALWRGRGCVSGLAAVPADSALKHRREAVARRSGMIVPMPTDSLGNPATRTAEATRSRHA
jgi:hypothetical protein